MITYKLLNGRPRPTQVAREATIYFDQWLWVDIANSEESAEELASLLAEAKVCLVYSVMSLLELSTIRSGAAYQNVRRVINSADFAFIEFNPRQVINREKAGIVEPPLPPDDDLVQLAALPDEGVLPTQPSELVLDVIEAAEHLERSRRSFGEVLDAMIQSARENPAVRKAARKRLRRKPLAEAKFPVTETLFGGLIDFIVVNRTMMMGPSEWCDLAHVSVPVAYCDVVVLDKRWADAIRRLGTPSGKIAKMYTATELKSFRDELHATDSWR